MGDQIADRIVGGRRLATERLRDCLVGIGISVGRFADDISDVRKDLGELAQRLDQNLVQGGVSGSNGATDLGEGQYVQDQSGQVADRRLRMTCQAGHRAGRGLQPNGVGGELIVGHGITLPIRQGTAGR